MYGIHIKGPNACGAMKVGYKTQNWDVKTRRRKGQFHKGTAKSLMN